MSTNSESTSPGLTSAALDDVASDKYFGATVRLKPDTTEVWADSVTVRPKPDPTEVWSDGT